MKQELTSKKWDISQEEMAAALAAAPDRIDDAECPYDPNDTASIENFWAKATVRLPGQRGPQKKPTKELVSVRLDSSILKAFRASGEGWQTRINAALADWLKTHSP